MCSTCGCKRPKVKIGIKEEPPETEPDGSKSVKVFQTGMSFEDLCKLNEEQRAFTNEGTIS
jgi:hypothetical protein